MSEAPANLDLRLFGLLMPDEAFKQATRDFMYNNAPSAHTVHLLPQLENFLNAFFRTSQDVHMQELLLMLHTRYSLDGLADPTLISLFQQNVLALQASRASQYGPLTTTMPPQIPLPQTSPPTPLNQEAQGGSSDQFQFVHVSMEEAAAIGEADTEDSKGAQPISRPNYWERIIRSKDPHWLYKCDRCGHPKRYRHEFHRHFEQQGIREGFKVVGTTTTTAPYRWHGADAAGNEYAGDMVYDPVGPLKRGCGRPRAPPPCGRGTADGEIEEENEEENEEEQAAAQSNNEESEDDANVGN